MPTKYCKSERLLLGEIYELIEENKAKFFYKLVLHGIKFTFFNIYVKKMLNYGEINMRHIYIYGNSPKDIFPQQYGHDHLIENDQYGQSINDQLLEFNGHKMSNESNLEWNGEKSIIGQELQKVFVPKVKSRENTYKFSKDETLIEEKSILTQELILGG